MNSKGLFLKASDVESCDVISSLLQDSIIHISSLSFHEDRKCLRLMVNRFCWELLDESKKRKDHHYFRVHSGLYIHNIKNISISDNFKKILHDRYLNLLAMHYADDEISILFSGHKNAYIKIDDVCIYLKDLHEKYPTPSMPNHENSL